MIIEVSGDLLSHPLTGTVQSFGRYSVETVSTPGTVHPEVVSQIWAKFAKVQGNLYADAKSFLWWFWFSLYSKW